MGLVVDPELKAALVARALSWGAYTHGSTSRAVVNLIQMERLPQTSVFLRDYLELRHHTSGDARAHTPNRAREFLQVIFHTGMCVLSSTSASKAPDEPVDAASVDTTLERLTGAVSFRVPDSTAELTASIQAQLACIRMVAASLQAAAS